MGRANQGHGPVISTPPPWGFVAGDGEQAVEVGGALSWQSNGLYVCMQQVLTAQNLLSISG